MPKLSTGCVDTFSHFPSSGDGNMMMLQHLDKLSDSFFLRPFKAAFLHRIDRNHIDVAQKTRKKRAKLFSQRSAVVQMIDQQILETAKVTGRSLSVKILI